MTGKRRVIHHDGKKKGGYPVCSTDHMDRERVGKTQNVLDPSSYNGLKLMKVFVSTSSHQSKASFN